MIEEIEVLKTEYRGFVASGITGIRTQIYGSLPVHSSSHSS